MRCFPGTRAYAFEWGLRGSLASDPFGQAGDAAAVLYCCSGTAGDAGDVAAVSYSLLWRSQRRGWTLVGWALRLEACLRLGFLRRPFRGLRN